MRHVICFGNELHGDDGFGPAVHARLAQLRLPGGWSAFNAGCRGLDALALFACDEAIIVDAAAPAGQPGRLGAPGPRGIGMERAISWHGAGVGYLLQALSALEGRLPALRILTAEMAAITPFQSGLSAPMVRAVEEAVQLLYSWMQVPCEDRRWVEEEYSDRDIQREER